jgi:class 3 adenylate cyclase
VRSAARNAGPRRRGAQDRQHPLRRSRRLHPDRADPEDIRATLRPYHARVKHEIERYGGTVEKFVGDAVMAVFGALVVHEDDAERAVRAALQILDAIAELNEAGGTELTVRAAVDTGEAIVALAARSGERTGIATGDVVNTASRLQNPAPIGGVVVGDLTYRATRDTIVYEELEPVSLKGKAEPVGLWRATGARSRFGVDAEAARTSPFVGRDHGLGLLQGTYARTVRESTKAADLAGGVLPVASDEGGRLFCPTSSSRNA